MLFKTIWLMAFGLASINTGLFLMGTLVMEPTVEQLEPSSHITIRKLLIKRLNKIAPFLMIGALLSAFLTATHTKAPDERWLMLGAAGLFLCMFLTTLIGNVPQNKKFLIWSPETYPANWKKYVAKWAFFDKLRFILCIGALVLEFMALFGLMAI